MENPVTRSINAGCYVFSPSVVDEIPLGQVVSIERETFPALVQSGRPVFGYKEQAYWLDVGTPAALFKGSRD
jgi:mannose-1-phosphate guanylyltransferase